MKSKKLLTLIIAVAVVVVVVVVLASVFAVRQVLPVYHNFEGGQTLSVEGAPKGQKHFHPFKKPTDG